MDRNLGASRAATSSTDAQAYGDLYQWGRPADGHQCRNSNQTTTLISTNGPGHGDFVVTNTSPRDWRIPQNHNLWQDVNGINNPCPSGYRLPTESEWEEERLSWSSNNAAGAFASPLKLPVAGVIHGAFGWLNYVGSMGYYWSSTVDARYSYVFFFRDNNAVIYDQYRANGFSVRCIKD